MSFTRIAVLGLGKVGHLAAELLHQSGFVVTGIDSRAVAAPFPTKVADLGKTEGLADVLKGQEAVLSCLPYHVNIGVSTAAHALGIHYFCLLYTSPSPRD